MSLLIKICGVRTPEAARACASAGADLAGLNLVAGSRRCVEPESARALLPHLGTVSAVGVFMDLAAEEVEAQARAAGVTWVQLHGNETPDCCEHLARSFKVIKAIRQEQIAHEELTAALSQHVELFLIDGRSPGSGESWAWESIAPLDGTLCGRPLLLAGGLDQDNVVTAVEQARPAGVDVASGVETDGAIDLQRVGAFCRRARQKHLAGTGQIQPGQEEKR